MSSLLSPLITYDRGPLNHITTCQERLHLCLTELHRDKAQACVILSNLDVFSGGSVCLCAAKPSWRAGKDSVEHNCALPGGWVRWAGESEKPLTSLTSAAHKLLIGMACPSSPPVSGLEFSLNVSCVLLLSLKSELIHHAFPRHSLLMLWG